MSDERHVSDETPDEDFASLLEGSLKATAKLEPGQKVSATVLQVGEEWVFLDVGQKGEGVLDVKELRDGDGHLTVAPGDVLSAYFLSRAGGELRFTTRLGGGDTGTAQLEEAWRSAIPVDGRVEKEIKGGFDVRLPGNVRAFCPFSQIGLRRPAEESSPVGATLPFRITQFGEKGRNIVVSHRVILEEEQQRQREELKGSLKEGQVVTGVVTSLREFGAFLDIGGIEGLIPLSELGYGRVEKAGDVLQVGQQLEVVIKALDWEKNRFSFSLRDTLADPWKKVGTTYRAGSACTGTVSRLANFGAFVTLEDGIDGLLHISQLGAGRRLKHASEALRPGQTLEVVIEKIEPEQRRISLVLAGGQEEKVTETSWTEKPAATGLGSFAELMKKAQEKKGKKR